MKYFIFPPSLLSACSIERALFLCRFRLQTRNKAKWKTSKPRSGGEKSDKKYPDAQIMDKKVADFLTEGKLYLFSMACVFSKL